MDPLAKIAPGKSQRQNDNASTQAHLRIGEIRDDVVVLKNGGLRAILETSSLNFNLKSEQEQNSIVYSYQNFLNSLEFPIQILIRSKKLDIEKYINQVQQLGDKQENTLLQEQTYEYAQYVSKLVDYADIMEKHFYVVIPYDPGNLEGQPNAIQSFFQRLSPKDSIADIKKRFNNFSKVKKDLMQRVNVVRSGLESCGLQIKDLKTKDLINLFYETYNPLSSRSTKLRDLDGISLKSDEELVVEEEKKAEKIQKAQK
ncbi:hypothetical protein KJ632_05440 [Patescibacteria group bacterium]|nr:hypothetical protein [Patescibacteria group bacterium]